MAKKIDRKTVLDGIRFIANDVYKSILKNKAPQVKMPLRSLTNVKYDQKKGFFELLGKFKARTLTASTIKTFAQTLLLMKESRRLAKDEDRASKREMYYVSKNWGDARFDTDSDAFNVMDDVEAMLEVNREQMSIYPGERGGTIAGKLIVIDGKEKIDCTKFGSGAYSIPSSVEDLKFQTKAKFILVVETTALFDRLNHHRYWEKANCIIIAMMGVPTRATRRFIRRLAGDRKLPVYVFTDGDPYGYLNIYRTLKVGSGNAAHINEFFCVPQAQFLGITPKDIIDYNLPSHPLKDVDIKRLKDGIKNDPFVKTHKEWQKALTLMAKHKKRAEQQAFAAKTLNYVYEVYLPEKLKNKKTWLP